jgi:HAD superfamily hydrolase (TIGR01509 family)
MNIQGIQNIIFDLGGVIINLDNKLTEKAFVDLGAKDFRNYFGHGFAASFFSDYEVGKISDRQFLSDLKKMIELDVPDQVIIDAWDALLLNFPPERIHLLDRLKKKYRLFLFSNTNALHLKKVQSIYRNEFGAGSLEDHFERTYYSHLIHLRKPDAASFEYIIHENKLEPSATMFVDDAQVNVDGASATGLRGFYLAPGTSITDLVW